jgi:tRNA U34 5-carboxymethylaminomethyl modifying GTPase MnmE/TrmE
MTKDNSFSIATKLAADNASKASELATTTSNTAVVLATKTAESIDWIKQGLSRIETKLETMDKAFVTSVQHQEVLSELNDHETRIRTIESNMLKWMGGIAALTAVLTMGIGIVLKLINL